MKIIVVNVNTSKSMTNVIAKAAGRYVDVLSRRKSLKGTGIRNFARVGVALAKFKLRRRLGL